MEGLDFLNAAKNSVLPPGVEREESSPLLCSRLNDMFKEGVQTPPPRGRRIGGGGLKADDKGSQFHPVPPPLGRREQRLFSSQGLLKTMP
jgi:hypothetical protein